MTDESEAAASAAQESEDEGHCEHCEGHHERIMAIEKHLGIRHESHGEEPEESDAERRHRERGERDERLSHRKRS